MPDSLDRPRYLCFIHIIGIILETSGECRVAYMIGRWDGNER